jgi:selenide,water dikinase
LEGIFSPADFPDMLVGLGDPDDAAVWRLDEQRALVVTTDFFTPVVDDPYDYGAIAAANALSDIYAMGGQPFMALNIAALPPDLPIEVSAEILRGGAEKVSEAGVALAGGHTIQDKEPKFGLVALGFVHPEKMITKGGAQPGDILVLSKPLGFGTVTTAIKNRVADPADVTEVVRWMKILNRSAGNLALSHAVKGGTDITGFSLLGHGLEVANASKVGMIINFNKLPFTSGALRYAEDWVFPGGASDNRLYYGGHIQFDASIEEFKQLLCFDPQTSGGLLLAVPSNEWELMKREAQAIGQALWKIGEVIQGNGIQVLP